MNNIIESTPPIFLRNYFPIKKKVRNQRFQDVTLTLRGRNAISLILRHFELKKQNVILVPGFSCGIIVDPFTENFTPEYYDIERDFSINTEVIESRLRTGKIKVLYVIHYFGFLHSNIEQISKLCRKYGVLLWEDHAQSALSNFSYNYADAMIFSFRKLLPIADGGGAWLPNLPPVKISWAGTLVSSVASLLILALRYKSRISRKLRGTVKPKVSSRTVSIQKKSKQIVPRPISYMSRRTIQRADYESICAVRRDIFSKWQHVFSNSKFNPAFLSLPDNVCPHSFPIWVKNTAWLLSEFWKFGIRLKMRWPLGKQAKEECPTAFDISESVFLLPIYPGLSEFDMQRMAALVERYGEPLT